MEPLSTRKRRRVQSKQQSKQKFPKLCRVICLKCTKKSHSQKDHYCNCKAGLLNIGNSCYINAVIQTMAELEIPLKNECPEEFRLFYQNLKHFSAVPLSISSILPSISYLWVHNDHQQDAHEFFMAILEAFDSSLFEFQIKTKLNCDACGKTITQTGINQNTFHMVVNGSSLQKQLQGVKEKLQAECAECGITTHTLFKKVRKFPKILVVKMNRFSYNPFTGNINKIVSRSEIPQVIQTMQGNLELSTVILHKGKTTIYGHYVTYIHKKEIELND